MNMQTNKPKTVFHLQSVDGQKKYYSEKFKKINKYRSTILLVILTPTGNLKVIDDRACFVFSNLLITNGKNYTVGALKKKR